MAFEKNNLKQYDDLAHEWWQVDKGPFSALFHINGYRFEYFKRFVSSWSGVRVLDIGCGGGFASESFARAGAQVTGVDMAERLLEVARHHAAEQGLSIRYQAGRAEKLQFAKEEFDVVACFDVLEHLPDVKATLSEVHRVLKPGGLFLFDTINRTWRSRLVIVWFLENVLKKVPKGTHDWNMFIKPEELRSELLQMGFNEVQTQGLQIRGQSLKSGTPRFALSRDESMLYLGMARKAVRI